MHNVRQRDRDIKTSGRSQPAVLVDVLASFLRDGDGNSVHVEMDDKNEMVFLLIQTKFMHDMAIKYSDMILVDGTYRLNKEGYPLHCILCEDGNGTGRPLCYIFVQNETEEVIQKAYNKF